MKVPPGIIALGVLVLVSLSLVAILAIVLSAKHAASSRLKRHVSFLHALLESLDTPLYLKDDSGRYAMVNRSFAFLVGLDSAETLGKRDAELGISYGGSDEDADQAILRTGLPEAGEFDLFAGGRKRTVFMTKIRLHDELGRAVLLGTVRDLGPERELANGLRDMNKRLEAQVAERTMELQRANAILERLAATDQLTGLANRRRLDHCLDEEMASWRRYGNPLSVIMLDIDHFKEVNDERGHQEGDRVLVWLAGLLRRRVRSTDVAGRWGGEEFLIVCRHSDLEAATRLAQSLREAVAQESMNALGFPLTASFGIAQVGADEGLRSLVSRVDDNLYMAKERGRNRVEA